MSGSEATRGRDFVADVGAVVLIWTVVVVVENIVIGVAFDAQFAGSWEMAHARRYVSPIAVGASLPAAVAVVALARLVAARRAGVLAVLGGLAAGAVAAGVSNGRHFESVALRAAFITALAAAGAAAASFAARRAPLGRPRALALAGVVAGMSGWLADAFVLPRLYPAFHLGLLALGLMGFAALALAPRGAREWRIASFVGLGLGVLTALWMPHAARELVGDDNLRRVLVEHAPLLGRAVQVAARIAPPPPLEDDPSAASTTAAVVHPGASARALDWTGRDIVLVTVDALRADHLSSYGYGRPTTPSIDRLAARGARFEHAYCPTPHTSYSVTSMMTGKYMRPLLAMGTGDDSETWATYLRRYGFRTAGFYPPAVFFIDEHRFTRMKADGLGFEYRKEEFAPPSLRRAQIAEYVSHAPQDKPLFLWVHLFEPHEPYEPHPDHVFGGGETSVDLYDGEIATADAEVGAIVEDVEKRRPGAVFIVSADHGEELGDHGGRYHGTTVYEEQVRVPLVVVGPGVAPGVVAVPVQTIDLLPTTLAALDVPQPSRVRGRDLGALLAGKASVAEEGLAFAETDDYTLVARGSERLVCVRKIGSCTLFDVRLDPQENKPIADRPGRVTELRKLTAAIERENGELETNPLPEALRRGLQGDRDAAEDVAALFDDARVDIRREAARCAFRLVAPSMTPQLERALRQDEDPEVKRWSALALVRSGRAAGAADGGGDSDAGAEVRSIAEAALRDPDARFRLAAALALAEQGDGRGEGELVARWERAFVPGASPPGEPDEARELLAALARVKARTAAPALARSLEDVRLRPFVVDTLGELGDARAVPLLLAAFASERYVDVRPREARALARLGAREALLAPLRRFAGVPEPMIEGVAIAREAGLLVPAQGGWAAPPRALPWQVEPEVRLAAAPTTVPSEVDSAAGPGPARLLVLAAGQGAVTGRVDGETVTFTTHGERGDVWVAELARVGTRPRVALSSPTGIAALWMVRRAREIPPPPPREWRPDGGAPAEPAPEGGL